MVARELHPVAFVRVGTLLLTLGWAPAALGHIDLVTPVPREQGRSREPNSNLKEGPCGQLANGRTDKISVFAPGETIEVTWRETTNHRSYYRVAFDVDGDDAFPTFAGSGIGAEGIDPSGLCPIDGQVILAYEMEDGSGGSHTLQIRLPDVECERCTLQVVQFMYDTMTPYYFQCADLALRRQDPADAGAVLEPALDAGDDATAAATSTPPSPSAAPGCSSQIAPDGARPAARDDVSDDDGPAQSTSPRPAGSSGGADARAAGMTSPPARRGRGGGGCVLAPRRGGSGAAAGLLLLGGGLALCRARRTRRPSGHGSSVAPGCRSMAE